MSAGPSRLGARDRQTCPSQGHLGLERPELPGCAQPELLDRGVTQSVNTSIHCTLSCVQQENEIGSALEHVNRTYFITWTLHREEWLENQLCCSCLCTFLCLSCDFIACIYLR